MTRVSPTHQNLALRVIASIVLTLVAAMQLAQAESGVTAPPSLCPNAQIFYYDWYGAPPFQQHYIHWTQGHHSPPDDIGSNFYPQLGPYSSSDPAVLRQHMTWLREAHIGVIVLSWWGKTSYEDQNTRAVMDAAAAAGIKVAFHLEPYSGQTPDSLADDVAYILHHYGTHPAFYRAPFRNNRPLFYSFETLRHPAKDWRPVTDRLHAGSDPILLIAQTSNLQFVVEGGFDGGYPYDGLTPFKHAGFLVGWTDTAKTFAKAGKLFIPSVGPGYDDARAVPNSKAAPPEAATTRDHGTATTYDKAWNTALNLRPALITITSFNEWHEGSQIEPAVQRATADYTYPGYRNGPDDYLNRTAAYVERYQTQLHQDGSK